MKNYLRSIAYLVFVLYLSSCTKTNLVDPGNEPDMLVETQNISIVSVKEFILHGRITKLNSEAIEDLGFIIYDKSPSPANPIQISLGKIDFDEPIAYRYSPDKAFKLNTPLSYVFYVKTKKALYKGKEVEFTIDLLNVDQQTAFYAKIGGTLEIKGDFSQLAPNDFVTIKGGLGILSYKLSGDKKTILIEIPSKGIYHGDEIELIINQPLGQNKVNQKRLALATAIGTFSLGKDREFYYTDVFEIEGVGFPRNPTDKLKIIINEKALVWSRALRIKDFGPFDDQVQSVSIDYGNEIVKLQEKIKIKVPDVELLKIGDPIMHQFNRLNITGVDFAKYFGDSPITVKIGDYVGKYTSLSSYDNSILTEIEDLPSGSYPIIISNSFSTLKLKDPVQIRRFKYEIPTMKTGYFGDVLRVIGDFVSGQQYTLFSNNYPIQHVLATNANELSFTLPNSKPNKYSFQIGFGNNSENQLKWSPVFNIEIKGPKIHSFSKTKVNVHEVIDVAGEGLLAVRAIILNDFYITPLSKTSSNIRMSVPDRLPPGRYKVSISYEDFYEVVSTDYVIEVL